MTGPAIVGVLLIACAIGREIAYHRRNVGMDRLLTVAGLILTGALLVYAVGELAL